MFVHSIARQPFNHGPVVNILQIGKVFLCYIVNRATVFLS